MITLEEVLIIPELVINKFGGHPCLSDQNLLESAIRLPNTTFDGQPLYPAIEDKVVTILESIVNNHPFFDGNKGVGYILMRLD